MAEIVIPTARPRDPHGRVGSGDTIPGDDRPPVGVIRASLSLAILVLLTMVSFADRSILQLLVDPIQRDLGIDDVQYSVLTGFAFASCYAIFTIPAGWLADRYSKRWIIFIGVLLWSAATAAGGLANSYGQLLVARMAVGIGEAMLAPAAYAIVGGLFSTRRLATAFGVLAAGTSLGSAAALVIGGLVVSWAELNEGLWGLHGWQLTFVLMGIPGLLAAPLVFVIPAERRRLPKAADPGQRQGFGRWLRANSGYVAFISLAAGGASALMYGVFSWLPALLSRSYGMGAAEIGSALGVAIGLTGALGFVISGSIVDRLAKTGRIDTNLRYVIVVVSLAAAIGALTFSLVEGALPIIVLVGLMSFIIPITGPVLAHLQANTPPEFRARAIALFTLVFNLAGMSLGASSVALISDRILGGPAHLAGGMAAACVIFGLLSAVLFAVSLKFARTTQ